MGLARTALRQRETAGTRGLLRRATTAITEKRPPWGRLLDCVFIQRGKPLSVPDRRSTIGSACAVLDRESLRAGLSAATTRSIIVGLVIAATISVAVSGMRSLIRFADAVLRRVTARATAAGCGDVRTAQEQDSQSNQSIHVNPQADAIPRRNRIMRWNPGGSIAPVPRRPTGRPQEAILIMPRAR